MIFNAPEINGFALSSCLVLGMTLAPSFVAFADDSVPTVPGGDFFETPDIFDEGGETMDDVFSGVGDVITKVVTPVATFCSGNSICLGFLACTFVGCGIRLIRKAVNAFGRGR